MPSFHCRMRACDARLMALARPALATPTGSCTSLGGGSHWAKARSMRARARLASHPCPGPRMRSRARQNARAARRAERQAFSA
eukprot:11868539-Alexandrium_andersonii.AAC.1